MSKLELIITVVVSIISSSALFTFIQFLINRKDKKEDKMDKIEKAIESITRSEYRTQLLVLMKDYPTQTQEILEVAQKYFIECNGNWYMKALFDSWLSYQNLGRPDWYKE